MQELFPVPRKLAAYADGKLKHGYRLLQQTGEFKKPQAVYKWICGKTLPSVDCWYLRNYLILQLRAFSLQMGMPLKTIPVSLNKKGKVKGNDLCYRGYPWGEEVWALFR